MKAIAVINEMPKDCNECPLNSNGYCDVLQEYALLNEWVEDAPYYSLKEKGDCPLKPLPEKKEVEANIIDDLIRTEFSVDNLAAKILLDTEKLIALGWNSCVEKIEN